MSKESPLIAPQEKSMLDERLPFAGRLLILYRKFSSWPSPLKERAPKDSKGQPESPLVAPQREIP